MKLLLSWALLKAAWGALTKRNVIRDGRGHAVGLAYGDGRHDDTANIQRALDRVDAMHLGAGVFEIREPLILRGSVAIHGSPRHVSRGPTTTFRANFDHAGRLRGDK